MVGGERMIRPHFNKWYKKHQDIFELGRAYLGVFVLTAVQIGNKYIIGCWKI